MTYVRLDDAFFTNPKARAAGVEGRALFVASVCYCGHQLNDGEFPAADIPLLAAYAEVPPSAAERLYDVGLWHLRADTVVVHDYLDWNDSRETVISRKERAAKAGSASGRTRRSTASSTAGSTPGSTGRPTLSSLNSDRDLPVVSPQTGSTGDAEPVDDEIWNHYAEQKCALTSGIKDPRRWKSRVAKNAADELGADARELLARYDLRPHEVATVLLAHERGERVPWLRTRERKP